MINELTMLVICGAVVFLLLALRGFLFRGTRSQGYRVWIINLGNDDHGYQEDFGDWPAEIDVPEDFFNRNRSFAQEAQPMRIRG